MRSLDDGLRLLAQVLRQVIARAHGLAGGARALPAAERLVSRPRAGGGALRAVGGGVPGRGGGGAPGGGLGEGAPALVLLWNPGISTPPPEKPRREPKRRSIRERH